MNNESYFDLILAHYKEVWDLDPLIYLWDKGPIEKMPISFRVLVFPPTFERRMWIYASCCMSSLNDNKPIELHIYSSIQDDSIIELLTVIAFYHNNKSKFGLDHTINFGRPWQNESLCEFGLISLPYLEGPKLENLLIPNTNLITKFYWIIPITEKEVEYKKKFGIEALETVFDKLRINYTDSQRKSLV